ELLRMRPDLIFLQEVDFRSARSFDIDQLRLLCEKLGMPYAAYTLTWNKKYVAWPYWPFSLHFGRLVSGQAVLSRFPIKQQVLVQFEKPAENPFWYNWFYLDRVVQRMKVEIGTQSVSVYNIHLEAFTIQTRKEQLQKLSDQIRQD